MALMGLLRESAAVSGSIRFAGQELVGTRDAQMCRLRGHLIGMVFQEPMTALNPVHTIGRQVAEPLRLHLGMDKTTARQRAIALPGECPRGPAAQSPAAGRWSCPGPGAAAGDLPPGVQWCARG